jgi:hypothetical protein
MIKVALLTETQKNLLLGVSYDGTCFFNPIKDTNENWIISNEEINSCSNLDYQWIKTLPLIEFKPKTISLF